MGPVRYDLPLQTIYSYFSGDRDLSCPYASPGRCLEVHMSTLRVFYDKWLASAYAGDEDGDDSDAETR